MQIRRESGKTRTARFAKKTGDMYEDLREHLRTYSGSPTDEFIVKNIEYYVNQLKKAEEDGSHHTYDKYFKQLLALFKDIGALPRQSAQLKRSVQLEETYDPTYTEKKRKELIKGKNEEIDL